MKKFIIIGMLFTTASLVAQQDAMFTHYAFNTISVNPAYAGNRGMMTASLLQRNQWVGFEGAPITQTFVINTPIYEDKLGLGVSIVKDKIGPVNSFTGNLDFSYSARLSKTSKLTFGLKGGASNYNRNLNNLFIDQGGDLSISGATLNEIYFNFGTGFLYTNKRFYLGASIPKLLENTFENPSVTQGTLASKEQRHYFITAGTVFDLTSRVELRPSTFVKATAGAPIEIDLTAMFAFNKKFEIGGMFRTTDAIGLLAGYVFQEKFRIGYSFDWSFGNQTFTSNNGSHELMIRYDFLFKGNKQVLSPRYF